ncbi:MAG: protein BatD [Legionella longbeachae]|nr:protein BatD [Legionella longbeachae]
MKKFIIISFFCLFSIIARAEIQAQVEPSQINRDQSFQLTLTQDNLQNRGVPDLTPLQKNFTILSTERRMNYSVINGQTQSSSEWIITLKAQKEGNLTIPSINIGGEYTTPIPINITTGTQPNTETAPNNSDQQQDIYLTTKVNKKNPYVNQQIIYKVTLYNSKHLLDADYQGPQVENALLIPLGEEKRYKTQKNNVNYIVEEQNYAIFPQKSGPLKIKSPVFTALIYGFNPERVNAQDKSINLDIQPIPKEYSAKIWLPAKEVKLTEQYENSEQTITQGNTLIRYVTLEGIGVPAQLLPTVNFAESDGFNVYPEKGKEKNQIAQEALVGSAQIKVTYLFNKAGKMTIPELKLPWFNTETGKEETASLPAKIIEVTPSSTTPEADTKQSSLSETPLTQEMHEATPKVKLNWAWIIAALFAFAWFFTLVLWAYQKHYKKTGKGKYIAALNDLHKACIQGEPQRARDALLEWARLNWPDAPILNLNDLTRLTSDPSFKKQVQILSQSLYKNQETILWRGDELWRSIQSTKKTNTHQMRDSNNLPPMNPL